MPLALAAETMIETTKAESPFKFLDYYRERDEELLGGRDKDVANVVSLLSSRPTLVLFGASGTGKTSLLLAGVFPRLKSLGWHPVYVRTLINPSADLDRAIVTQLGSSADDQAEKVLIEASKGSPVVIVLDQFEEFFLRFKGQAELRNSFAQRLAGFLKNREIDCRIVFSLREDYLAKLDGLRRFLPALMDNRFSVQNLSAYGAREAISRPLRASNIPADNRLLSRIVDLLAKFGFDPVILQITCVEVMRAAEKRDRNHLRLTVDDLEAVGGIDGIFRGYLDRLENLLPEADHLLARIVLDRLITQSKTKQAMRITDFGEGPYRVPEDKVEDILEALVRQKLVRKDDRSGTTWYELIHERLVDIIRDWIRLGETYAELDSLRKIIDSNAAAGLWRTQPDLLLNEGVLERLLAKHQHLLRFDPVQAEFVLWSVIFRRVGQISYWRKQVGDEETDRLLGRLLTSETAKLRRGAAVAVGRLEAPARELVDRCVRLSLDDEDDKVRRSAAQALARVASEEQLEEVKTELGIPEKRQAAMAVIAELRMAGRTLKAGSLWDRLIARRMAAKQQLRAKLDFRTERAHQGWFSGIVSGVTWAFTVGIAYLFVLDSVFVHEIAKGEFMGLGFIILSVSSVLFGLLFGFSLPRTHARNIVLGRGKRWWRAVVRDPVYILSGLSLAAVIMLATLSSPSSESMQYLGNGLMLLGVFWIMIPCYVGLVRACLPETYIRSSLIFWALSTCLVAPLSVSLPVGVFVAEGNEDVQHFGVYTSVFLFFATSLITAIASGVLSTAELRVPEPPKDLEDV